VSLEALELRRELVAANRDAYVPDLAMSLDNHAIWLFRTGRRDESLRVSQEALTLRRDLTVANRALHLHDLAQTLHKSSGSAVRFGQGQRVVLRESRGSEGVLPLKFQGLRTSGREQSG
jgi:hypothetical protein